MLFSILAALLPLASAAAVVERQGQDPTWPWWRVTCSTSSECNVGNAQFTYDSTSELTSGCIPTGGDMKACKLERFQVEGGVPGDKACKLSLYNDVYNGQCVNNLVPNIRPVAWQSGWTCGVVGGWWSIKGIQVDCNQPGGVGFSNSAEEPQTYNDGDVTITSGITV